MPDQAQSPLQSKSFRLAPAIIGSTVESFLPNRLNISILTDKSNYTYSKLVLADNSLNPRGLWR